jgi:sugar phosphate isomerase/epimerase
MKVGAQLYTIREYTKTPGDIILSLEAVRNLGYSVIQISGFGPYSAEKVGAQCKNLGLTVACTHSPWESMQSSDVLAHLIHDHELLNCTHIGLGSVPTNVFPHTTEGYRRLAIKFNEIIRQVEASGMTFGYHNHHFEFERFDSVTILERLADACPKLQFIFDVYWAQAGGVNPVTWVQRLSDRIQVLHLKDYQIKNREAKFAEIGQGTLEWESLLQAAKDIPYGVVEQDDHWANGNPFDSLKTSFDFLSKQNYIEV